MQTLHLTPAEREIFLALPDNLREGWTVEEEVLQYEDSALKRHTRISLMRLHDPVLLQLQDRVHAASTMQEVLDAMQEVDLSTVSDEDVAQLYFALGPDVLSHAISSMLSEASDDASIEAITALSVIRHEILASFHPSA